MCLGLGGGHAKNLDCGDLARGDELGVDRHVELDGRGDDVVEDRTAALHGLTIAAFTGATYGQVEVRMVGEIDDGRLVCRGAIVDLQLELVVELERHRGCQRARVALLCSC